jgi:hypothetical protein
LPPRRRRRRNPAGNQADCQGQESGLAFHPSRGGEPAPPSFSLLKKSRRKTPLRFLPAPSSRFLYPAPARRLRGWTTFPLPAPFPFAVCGTYFLEARSPAGMASTSPASESTTRVFPSHVRAHRGNPPTLCMHQSLCALSAGRSSSDRMATESSSVCTDLNRW